MAKWIEESDRGETEWMQKLARQVKEQLRVARLNVSSVTLKGFHRDGAC